METTTLKDELDLRCMDPRLNALLDSRNTGDVRRMRLSNGGCNVRSLERSIKAALASGRIAAVNFYGHEDCAAMKFTRSVLEGGLEAQPSKTLQESLVNQFKKPGTDVDHLDVENHRVQLDTIRRYIKGTGVALNDRYVDFAALPLKSHAHSVVAMIEPFYGRYADVAKRLGVELGGMYVLQALDVRDLLPDIELAKTLVSKDITLLRLGEDTDSYTMSADLIARGVPEVNVTVTPL